MSAKRQIGKQVAWMAFGNWTEQAINLLLYVVLARLLGADAFGILAMAGVFVVISEILVRETIAEGIVAAGELSDKEANNVFWLGVSGAAVLTAVLFILSGLLADFYQEPQVAAVIRALALTVPMIALTAVPVAILRRDMRFKALSLRAILGVVAGGVAGLALALAGAGVWALVAQRLVQVGVNILVAWGAVTWRPGRPGRPGDVLRSGHFGARVLVLRASDAAAVQLPMLIIGAAAGPVVLGFFSVAWRVVELSSFLVATPIRLVSQSAFAAMRRAQEDDTAALNAFVGLAAALAVPAYFGLAILAEPFVALFFGANWHPAAAVLTPLALLGIYLVVDRQFQSYCLAAKQVGRLAMVSALEIPFILVCVYIAARWGGPVAAAALVLWRLAYWPAKMRAAAQVGRLRWHDLARRFAMPVAGGAIMALAVLGLDMWLVARGAGAVARLASGAILGSAVFGAFAIWRMPGDFAAIAALLFDRHPVKEK